jgi:hypothetical protein
MSRRHSVSINRAPVLTLWAAIVAQRLGFDADEALTLGRAVAGLNAYAKAQSLGLVQPKATEIAAHRRKLRERETLHVDLMGRAVPVVKTPEGLRAASKGKPIDPASVERYLAGKFGEAYADARAAMASLAKSLPPQKLAAEAYRLYTEFRPEIPKGEAGWGAKGRLDLEKIRDLAS